MKRSEPLSMAEAVARFQAEIQRLAFDHVRAVLRQELDRMPAYREPVREPKLKLKPAMRPKQEPAQPSRRKRGPKTKPQLELSLVPESAQPAQLLVEPAAQPAASPEPVQTAVAPAAPVPDQPPSALVTTGSATATTAGTGRKRVAWTRESIVHELATWVSKGTVVDASFLTRHGPPGLVAATKRVFGRFEAAMNVVALHLSKMNPEGPPAR